MDLHTLFVILSAKAENLYTPRTLASQCFPEDVEKIRRNLGAFARNNHFAAFDCQTYRAPDGTVFHESDDDVSKRLEKEYGSFSDHLKAGQVTSISGRKYDAFSGGIWLLQTGPENLRVGLFGGLALLCFEGNKNPILVEDVAQLAMRLASDSSDTFSRLFKKHFQRKGVGSPFSCEDISLLLPKKTRTRILAWVQGDEILNTLVPFEPEDAIPSWLYQKPSAVPEASPERTLDSDKEGFVNGTEPALEVFTPEVVVPRGIVPKANSKMLALVALLVLGFLMSFLSQIPNNPNTNESPIPDRGVAGFPLPMGIQRFSYPTNVFDDCLIQDEFNSRDSMNKKPQDAESTPYP